MMIVGLVFAWGSDDCSGTVPELYNFVVASCCILLGLIGSSRLALVPYHSANAFSGLLVLSFIAMVILVILWCCGCVGEHVQGASKGMIRKLTEFKFTEECESEVV